MEHCNKAHIAVKMKMTFQFIFAATIVLLLYGCAGRSTPAPVDNVYVKSKDKPGIKYNSFKDRTFYKVTKGDTLYSIAWRSGMDYRKLAKINNIKAPYQISIGQIVRVRPKKGKPAKNKRPTPVVKNKTVISPKIVAKTLATPKQQAYGQLNKNKKPLKTSKKVQDGKPKNSQLVKQKSKPYSNKIRSWVWPSAGKIIATFSNKENGNKGIDISGRLGSSVVSAADGKVVYYGNALRGYGNLIIIKHNDDYLSAYAHNRKVLVKEQEFVKAGQKIAEMGDSDSERIKLRFEVRYRGKSVNPLKYLPKR